MTVKKSELSRLLLDLDVLKELIQFSSNLKLAEMSVRLEQDFDLVSNLVKELQE